MSKSKESKLAIIFKFSLLWKPDGIITCFRFCVFNLYKTKTQKIKAKTRKSKINYLAFSLCEN